MNDFLATLSRQVLVGDGAMGTQLEGRLRGLPAPALNLDNPDAVRRVHIDYIEAGARLIETNTFCATMPHLESAGLQDRCRELNEAGARLARAVADAYSTRIWVAGSIGPLGGLAQNHSYDDRFAAYREQAAALEAGGVDAMLLETFSELGDLLCAVRAVRQACPNLPLIAQMAFTLGGVTAAGVAPEVVVRGLEHEAVDVIGANCGGGEVAAKHVVRALSSLTAKPISIYPNRGLADLGSEGRSVFAQAADYFAAQCREIVEIGAGIIGGCCGTTPTDIARLARLLGERTPSPRRAVAPVTVAAHTPRSNETVIPPQRAMTDMAAAGATVIVEIDPPRGLNYAPQLEGCRHALAAGADSITVADNALSIMRMSNLAFTALLIRELNANVTMHVACRDRNLIGLQSHLFGAAALGVTNILAITGDPVSTGSHKGCSGVFDISSVNLMHMLAAMSRGDHSPRGDGELRPAFCVGGAFNSGARNLEAAAKRSARKVEAGMAFVMTQPVYEAETAQRILDLHEPLGIPVFLGIMPLVSERNAEFLHNEVPGISIPEAVRARMKGKSGAAGRAEGLGMAKELIASFFERSRTLYLITPFDRYDMVAELAGYAKTLVPTRDKRWRAPS